MATSLSVTPVSDIDFGLDLRPEQPRLPGPLLHGELARLREVHRLAPVEFNGVLMHLITRFEDLDASFRDDEGLPAGPTYAMTVEGCQGVTFESVDGPEHDALRDLSTRALRKRPTDRYAAADLPRLADLVIDRFVDRGSADLVAEFTAAFPFLVFADRMGMPFDAADRFMDWAFDILGFGLDPERGIASAAELTAYLEPVLQSRRTTPRDDLLSSMCTAVRDERQLSDEEIRSHVRALFSAGATTSYHGLGNTLYALLAHPGVMSRLCDEPELIGAAVEEMLRWEPPLALLPRLAPHDVRVAGHEVPAGTMLLFGIASANRDPAVFDRPDTFDVNRRPLRLLTFGFGSHHCPGSHLARAQIEVAIDRLLARLPALSLSDESEAQPAGTVMRGPMRLRVTWQN